MNGNTLKDLLPEKLKSGLTPAEEKLLESAQEGAVADFQSGDQEKDNPENSEKWGPERTIRADFLYWLCTDPEAVIRVHARGIAIRGAKIAGALDFTAATLPHPLAIRESALEDITLDDAETRSLAFSGSSIHSISADGLSVKGDLFLKKVTVKGKVQLFDADIGGVLGCDKATFENPKGDAFGADRLSVRGSIFLTEVTAKGEVSFLGADIRGQLTCEKATFENSAGKAFVADGLSVKGDMFLSEVKATGEVRLPAADIGGVLTCEKATFEKNQKGYAFIASGLSVKGNMFLSEVKATGEVRLLGADIGGQLFCNGATFENSEGTAFMAETLKVTEGLFFTLKKTTGRLNLMHAEVGVLVDQEESWPQKGDLLLDGFEYGALAGSNTPQTVKKRLEWLRLQPKRSFSLQPYKQLAEVFRNAGRESDAKAVLIAKHDDLREFGKLNWWDWLRNWFLGKTIGHGYEIWRVLPIALAFWLIGSGFFCWANCLGIMQPTKEQFTPSFNAMVFSLDSFVPFINLHQEDFWLPDASRPYGWWFQLYLWIHIFVGWGLSTLAALSLTGLMRKD